MITPVPSLSSLGWVTAPAQKADLLISHFYETNKSQSYVYDGAVVSLQSIVEEYSGDILGLTQHLQQTLQNYLSRYYKSAFVEVRNNDNSSNKTNNISLYLYCKVIESDDSEFSFGKLLEISDAKIKSIVNINNG